MKMFKVFIMSIVFGIIIGGCTVQETNEVPQLGKQLVGKVGGSNLYVVEVDGHEYLSILSGYRGGICHKADCKYCEDK